MADNAQLYRGANRLFSLLITDSTGTNLARTSIASAYVEVRFNGAVVDTFVYGTDNEFRAGTASNEYILEITSAFTTALTEAGTLTAKLFLTVTDTDFDVEPDAFKDIQETDLADIL